MTETCREIINKRTYSVCVCFNQHDGMMLPERQCRLLSSSLPFSHRFPLFPLTLFSLQFEFWNINVRVLTVSISFQFFCPSALCCATQTQMIHQCQKQLGYTRRIGKNTMNLQGNGRASTPCDALNLLQRLSLPKIGCPFDIF